MPEKNLLTANQVREQFGFARSSLLRWEEEGKIKAVRTPGGQRRYDIQQLQGVMQGEIYAEPQEKRPPYRELGTAGATRWGSALESEFLPELRGASRYAMYREMRMNDPVIAAVLFAVEATLKQAKWRVKPASEKQEDKDCAEFIDQCLNDMSFSWSDTLDFVLLMLEQGFSVLEPVYKRRLGPNPPNYTKDPAQSKYFDGRIGWRKWAPRPATTLVEGEEWEYDETGGIKGCNQGDNYGNKKFIPIERLLLFRTTAAPANAPDGISILRGMYVPYYYGKNFQEIEGIGVERDLGGLPVIYLGSNCSLTGENSDYEMAKKLAENMRSDTQVGVVIPNHKMGTTPDSTGVLIELLSSQSTRAHNVSEIIDRYDRLKALAALAQFIMLGMQKVGSFALAGTQNDLFTRAVATWLTKISDVINRFAIPRLLRYNAFPDITGMPEIEPSDVGTPNLQDLSWYINNLVGQEVIKPDIELERHLRHVARLPEPMEEDETGGQPRRKLDIKDNALVLRRIILAMKELPTYESMTDEELWALVAPLVDQLRLSVEDRTGVKIPNLDQGDKTTGLTMGELDLKSAAKKKTAATAGTPRLDVRPGTGTLG